MEEQKRQNMLQLLIKETSFAKKAIENVVTLIEEGNTVPFIARYRKELTGSLDEVQIRTIVERWSYINNLETRKEEVIRIIGEQEKLTVELHQTILKATKLQEVEDLYRPYKQKRRTKATVAKERGLEPLAEWLLTFPTQGNLEQVVEGYISEENEVVTAEDAIQGAKDIIAEWISDDPEIRKLIRQMTYKDGKLISVVKKVEKDEKGVFEMYYEYEEQVSKIVPHRILAINRGEKEGVLRISLATPLDKIITVIERKFIKSTHSLTTPYVKEAIGDSYKRLIEPSIEREIRKELSEKGEDQAIHIFSENLRNLLLQPPLKGRVALGVDPAYRTGCKLAVVDDTGKVLHISVIYPTPPRNEIEKGKKIIKELISKHNIEVIAIGNGTASRETEQFIADVIKEVTKDVYYLIVNEAGASVYSASPLGREEFPDLQVEERSAISIARRLQDPLAELVKIDTKSVGVGQYQHDVTQSKLNDSLTFVVEMVVNQVGVNVNTASSSLLQYVSGLSKAVANNIVKKRDEDGKFINRAQLKKIPRLGAKTYEQCIGFMRVIDGKEPLDQTGIHPESYKETKKLLKQLGATENQIGSLELSEQLKQLNLKDVAEQLDMGIPTLQDIVEALIRPNRDPRDEVATPLLKKDVLQLEDLQTGMELQGTIRNVVDFGAFVDIGVKQDGLVHISKLTSRFVKHPMEVVAVGDVVTVWVEGVDAKKQRIALTLLKPEKQI
ncbi:Tex family protein [Bacillaceae bacterium IKA-2]|nr:Tex family protein [Bacillaceae bacterium IKA-2]